MKIYIRTTGERVLHPSIKRELGSGYELLIDREHKPVDSFINQLEFISNEDSLLIEDDVILCHNFLDEVNKAIREYPNLIINFFNAPLEYYTSHIEIGYFVWNQCTYYPKGISKVISENMTKLRKQNDQYDLLERKAMNFKNIPYVNYRPTLVQHIDFDSLIQNRVTHNRRTKYFKDYLDELGISINEAYKYKSELRKILEREFNTEEDK